MSTPHVADSLSRGAGRCMSLGGVALVAALASCATGPSDPTPGNVPRLVLPGDVQAGMVQVPARSGQHWVHGTYTMCLDRPGSVDVTAVEAIEGDLDITSYALRPNPAPIGGLLAGDQPGTLKKLGIVDTPLLTRVCDGKGNSYELVLEARTGDRSTDGDEFSVRYVSGGHDLQLRLPLRIVHCVDPEVPDCL